jgi:S-formylglutathione hydrolase
MRLLGHQAFTDISERTTRCGGNDASELIARGARMPDCLVDQGTADKFFAEQLHIEALENACAHSGQPLTLRRHAGYDHGYYFIATFVADHFAHHARFLL